MQIAGSWYMQVGSTFISADIDRARLFRIALRDCAIILADGSRPAFTNVGGVLSFDGPLPDEPDAPAHARFVIDRGNDRTLGGRRYASPAPLPDQLDAEDLPEGVSCEPILLLRESYLDELEPVYAEQRAMLAALEAEPHEPAIDYPDTPEGRWYLNPGDIPADYVWPVELRAGGGAEWNGREARWRSVGEAIELFDPVDDRAFARFPTTHLVAGQLLGQLFNHYEPDAEDPEDPGYFTDSAVLLRDPRGFTILKPEPADAAA